MTEELEKPDGKRNLAILLKVVLGIVFLILGAWAILAWWGFLVMIVKGSIGLFLFLAGIIALAIAKE